MNISEIMSTKNLVKQLEKSQLVEIGEQVVRGYEIDEESRSAWSENVSKAMEIAKQEMTEKSFPWPGAANVKYPLITQASIDYAARTLPEIIQGDRIVKAATVGMDPESEKYKRAMRVSQYMSYQLSIESADWEDGTDKLLQVLPTLGTVFKKTSYNPIEDCIVSELCVPDKIVVNYNVPSLEKARRITHKLTFYGNDIIERQKAGIFNDDVEIDSLKPDTCDEDVDFPITLLEQHCWYDLDKDGYKEPYVITVHKESRQVLRVVPRFKQVHKDAKGDIKKIDPEQYFTDFHFIRSPDGGFYSMGFGTLLLPINTSINTIINQLLDAGTLSNTQGGFLGRGLRIKTGELQVKQGEWKVLDCATGTDIASNVYPLPVREPSATLFSLLQLLIQVGRDLTSTTDVLSGKSPAQNVASATISQLVEQGTKVFIAINKRLYRSLKKEYQKIYDLNYVHLKQRKYAEVLDDPDASVKKDFEPDTMSVYPVADPEVSSANQRMTRAGVVQQLRTADPREADILMMQSLQFEQSTIDKLLPQPDPEAPPPPDTQKVMAEIQKLQAEIAVLSAKATLEAEKISLEKAEIMQSMKESESRIAESMARIVKMQKDAAVNEAKVTTTYQKMQHQETRNDVKLAHEVNQAARDGDREDIKVQVDAATKLTEDEDD